MKCSTRFNWQRHKARDIPKMFGITESHLGLPPPGGRWPAGRDVLKSRSPPSCLATLQVTLAMAVAGCPEAGWLRPRGLEGLWVNFHHIHYQEFSIKNSSPYLVSFVFVSLHIQLLYFQLVSSPTFHLAFLILVNVTVHPLFLEVSFA